MKAAKLPPTPDMIGAAAYVVDLLTPGVRDPAKRTAEEFKIIINVIHDAIAEYLRQFPRARNKGRTWILRPNEEADDEWDYLCVFCAKSLNTLPSGSGTLPTAFVRSLEAHSDLCGAMFLAGMITGKPPTKSRKGS